MNITELREKRAQAWEKAKDFLDTHRRADGMLSAPDVAAYEKLESVIINLGAEIARLERLQDMDATMRQPVTAPITVRPGCSMEDKTGRASTAYKNAMLNAIRSNFKNINDVLREGSDSSGGYLVPEEYDSRLVEALEEENIFRKLATIISTSGLHKINVAASKPAAAWVEEGEALTFSNTAYHQVILDAYKLHVAIKVTEELLFDNAYGLENHIIDSFAKALGNAEESAFLNGDGNNKPTGIFHAEGGGEIGVTTKGTTVTADEIIDLVYKLKRPYRKNAVFILNDQTLSAIRKLKDTNGTYLWQPALVGGEPDRILGYPVYTSVHVPVIAAGAPVIAFGDFSYYNIGDRGTRSFSELKELFAGNGQVAFVCKQRVDGKLILPEAVQILKIKGSTAA